MEDLKQSKSDGKKNERTNERKKDKEKKQNTKKRKKKNGDDDEDDDDNDNDVSGWFQVSVYSTTTAATRVAPSSLPGATRTPLVSPSATAMLSPAVSYLSV